MKYKFIRIEKSCQLVNIDILNPNPCNNSIRALPTAGVLTTRLAGCMRLPRQF